ncbi:type IV toxin-antitoxin system AbiEi family antitoxin domain-containing protein [Nocardioides sp. KC13]|uniref:Type IV toxin-antitoxin system AbiEi family antitoxin domain-containing protein n=1 Tax=Nocardioides turkmenicus TaxID=2711220 RepID=A0A6M1RCH8_9ACTN|nr:type IV toxin-antitoxin system AbiEi family antitoxin domain-containing protein [Nocardioides sp. KC13]NGN95249.1 type IV toxin-antitoxin system AbiEi family antitoxin domain-containing protein [Nocardioides sp. KC13]
MNPRIQAVMAAHHGLITRRQALESGLDVETIHRYVRSGAWTVVRRGVYAERAYVESITLPTDRQRLLDRAACAAITVPFVRSHDTAALELDMGILLPRNPQTHVTRHPVVGSHNKWGVKHHLAPYLDEQVVRVNGFEVLGLARTAIDIAREHGRPYGVVAVDSARRMGVSVDDLWEVLDHMQHWPNRRLAREAIELSYAGVESIGESLTRDVLEELGLTGIETQFDITDGIRTARFDLRVGRHIFEFDGRSKYVPAADGGLALRSVDDILAEEKTRQAWAHGFHLGMSRVEWPDLFGRNRDYLKDRLAREYLATCRAFGTDISDLERFRVHRSKAA